MNNQPANLLGFPQAVDTDLFNPTVEPLDLGLQWDSGYRFLSVFKWEKRKGWDILLRAYFEARGENSRMWLE